MTAVLRPGSTASGGGSVPDAVNSRGSALALTEGGTATLCSFVAGTRKLRGFSASGTTDGEVWIEVDGVELDGLRERMSRVLPAYVVLPNPEPYSSPTAVVALRVENTGPVTGDFRGTLFGE